LCSVEPFATAAAPETRYDPYSTVVWYFGILVVGPGLPVGGEPVIGEDV